MTTPIFDSRVDHDLYIYIYTRYIYIYIYNTRYIRRMYVLEARMHAE
jgi:hypothetical protein